MSSEKENLEPSRSYSAKPLEIRRLLGVSSSSSSSSGSPRLRTPLKSLNSGGPEKTNSPFLLKHSDYPEELDLKSSPMNRSNTPKVIFRTPGRLGSPMSSKTRTPSGSRFNPFDFHTNTENLHLPIMSPSLFSTVLSPSNNLEGEFWALDDRAHLFPVNISEDSPWKQENAVRKMDPETEHKTQAAFDRYFNHHHEITSPLIPPSNNIEEQPSSMTKVEPPCEVWTQTELTLLPGNLPEEVENLLNKYSTFTQAQTVGNTSLRRKLFSNLQDASEEEEEEKLTSEDEVSSIEHSSSPVRVMPPGMVIYTPPGSSSVLHLNNPTDQASSLMKLAGTPPFAEGVSPPVDIGSPIFSPIGKPDKANDSTNQSSEIHMKSVIIDDIDEDSDMDTNSVAMSPQRLNGKFLNSKSPNNYTSYSVNGSTEVTLHNSSVGYVSGGSSRNSNVAKFPSSMTSIDSAIVSTDKSVPFDLSAGSHLRSSYVVSYASVNQSNDISVGNPLVSSTPTKVD